MEPLLRARSVLDLVAVVGPVAFALLTVGPASADDLVGPDDFEIDFGSWSNVGGDAADWTRNSGGTASTGTGPSDDHTPAGAGFYLYTEATGGQTGDQSFLDSPCIDLNNATDANLALWYHMLGGNMGNLHVQVASSVGAACGSLGAFATEDSWTGNQDLWIQRSVNLDAYVGLSIQIRLLGERGGGFESDMAIDDVLVTATLSSGCVVDPDCDDANDCTDDVCNAGTCQYTNNTDACDDGNSCTTGDVCSAGLCLPGAQTCGPLADYVIQVSIDGLPSDQLLTRIDTPGYENLKRFVDEGATTFNARIDYTQPWTNPNHASMITGRPAEQPAGQPNTTHHGFLNNGDPQPSWTYHGPPPCGSPSHCNPNVSYIASTFDVAHDNGLSTALYASKAKFVIMEWSYDLDSGAPDVTGPDDGADKIDSYVNKESGAPLNGSEMHLDFLADMAANRFNYTFLHYRDPDSAGHDFGWGSAQWEAAVQNVDDYLGEVFNLVETDPLLQGRTAIVLTADHGGQGNGHGNASLPSVYTIPFFAWGAGVDVGTDLYALNPTSRQDPGSTIAPGGAGVPRPDYNAARPPIRDGDTGNLALYLLGVGAVPGSTINDTQDLRTQATTASFTAYNDCVHDAALSDTNPHGTVVHYRDSNATVYGIGTICNDCGSTGAGTPYSFTSGLLVDVATGDPTPVTATFTQNGGVSSVDWQSQVGPAGSVPGTWNGGYDPAASTDAANTFGGIVDMTGTISYGGVGWWVDLSLTGLDPAKTYTFATSAARSNTTGDFPIRATIYTLSGADSSVHASSVGTTEISSTSVSFVTGDNDTNGYVARWTAIDPGVDGTITIRAEADPTSPSGQLAYAFDVFMLEEAEASTCGDGALDAGEDCDNGPANGTAGQCCSATCAFELVATECRAAAGVCDVAEACDGATPACPADGFASATTECRASSDVCDLAEQCTGSVASCPADALAPPTTVCRVSAGICDIAESCSGADPACPADGVEPTNTICRGSSGACDPAELCDGATTSCPANVLEPATSVCRAPTGVCDIAETCTGSSGACPGDALAPATTECRAALDVCDAAELCDGASAACPADTFEPATIECRASTGLCDSAETCTGSGVACPADSVAPAATECRATGGPCDLVESCDGVAATCPADQMLPAVTECRASTAICDAIEYCDGATAGCPSDGFKPASVGCRGTSASCDVQENCTGLGAFCPPDAYKQAGEMCRPQLFECDVAEFCGGLGIFCPLNGTMSVGALCEDGNACTVGEQCSADLECGGAGTLDCDDGNLCTADSCDSQSGCGNAVIEGCAPDLPATSGWGLALLVFGLAVGGALLLSKRQIWSHR
jgi:hypothetical protein